MSTEPERQVIITVFGRTYHMPGYQLGGYATQCVSWRQGGKVPESWAIQQHYRKCKRCRFY